MVYTPDEIESLQKLRAELGNSIESFEKEHKALEEETKTLREKLAIRELLKSVRKRREELRGLRLQRAGQTNEETSEV